MGPDLRDNLHQQEHTESRLNEASAEGTFVWREVYF